MKVVMFVLLSATAAHAEAPPGPIDATVDQAIAQYRAHDARLAAARAEIDVAAADRIDAAIYPNPTLGIAGSHSLAGTDVNNGTQIQLSLDVPILIGHQRARRGAAADAKVVAARAAVDVSQGEGELTVRDRFAALLAAQDRTLALAASLADARSLRDVVAARTTAGASSPYAVERIDLAIAAMASRVDEARAEERAAVGELAIAVGVPSWAPHAIASAPDGVTGEHPALIAGRAARAAATADVARQEAEATITPSLGFQSYVATDPGDFVGGLGLSIPLPLFDRNQGGIARARAEAHRADLELAAEQAELAGALAKATAVLAARRDALAHFEADAMQRLAKLRTMAETSYRSGQGGIVELLDALDAITDAKLRAIELRAAVAAAELEVRRASIGR